MRSNRAVELSTGLFVLLGFAALFFLVTQITNRELSLDGGSYTLQAYFENIGSLKVGAPVSMAGVTIGRVESIRLDQSVYKAVVDMRINAKYDRIPTGSDASILTSGLLGGQYIGIGVGGGEEYMQDGDRFELVQDAVVLENLIAQLFASFSNRSGRGGEDSPHSEE